ncbi:unnamed protein product [Trichobilharzia szidati]|nr:unnamed protein product [Trichobilharzia szidati]
MKCFSSVFSQSSLVPLAKIANAPSRSLRLLWATVTAIMFIGLCVCISLVVMQYLKHQTVFQLDYSGRHTVYDQVPGITICPQSQESKRLFTDAMKRFNIASQSQPLPWFSKTVMDQFRAKALEIQPNLKFSVIVNRLPKGDLLWNTSNTAISPIYRMLLNFSVEFQIQPSHLSDSYRLTVMEQVPNKRNFLCTTFELLSKNMERVWSYLEIRINQENNSEGTNRVTFTVITHERGELPFSAYDRHIHTILPPETSVSLYFSKSVTTRLNTARNPCHVGADAKFIASELTIDTESENVHQKTVNDQSDQLSPKMLSSASRSTMSDGTEDYDINSLSNMNINENDGEGSIKQQWYLDYLDTLRMKNNKKNVGETTNYLQQAKSRFRQKNSDQRRSSKSATVSLFGTEFLYSREACGWAECCAKTALSCNSTCSLDLLSAASQSQSLCERSQCQDEQISYETCPLPCIQTKFMKHSEVRLSGSEDDLPTSTSRLKLVRSESVQVATEEEIFSLAKLFSEVGGLCSLFIGFSCIFLFELLEALILMHYPKNKTKKSLELINNSNVMSQPEFFQHNDEKCLKKFTAKTDTDSVPQITTDYIISSPTTTTINTTNMSKDDDSSMFSGNDEYKKSQTQKFDDPPEMNKANVSTFPEDEYLEKATQLSSQNKYFNGLKNSNYPVDKSSIPLKALYQQQDEDIDRNHEYDGRTNNGVNKHILSLYNRHTTEPNEVTQSSHVYMLPIRLTTNVLLHKIMENQTKTASLNSREHSVCSADMVGRDYNYSETITMCSREELIELLHQNRIRIKVMFTEQ